jgi:hypothetical protein
MEYRFNAAEWSELSAEDRVRRCRLMAEEARLLAERAPPSLKQSYAKIAQDWIQLAADIENGGG